MTTDELLQEINRLPIERRILIAEYILESLNPADSDIEASWKEEVERRMKAVKEGKCRIIPSQELHDEFYHLIEGKK